MAISQGPVRLRPDQQADNGYMIHEYAVVDPSTPHALQQRLAESQNGSAASARQPFAPVALELTVLTRNDELARRRTPHEDRIRVVVTSVHLGDVPYLLGHIEGKETEAARLGIDWPTDDCTEISAGSIHLVVAS